MKTGSWVKFPTILEINTWPWLTYLSEKYKKSVDLSNIPPDEWDQIARGYDAIWLMGVWTRSKAGREITLHHEGLHGEYHRVLPDFQPSDVVGSPYAIKDYTVDPHLGGDEGLYEVRKHLHEMGKKIILDFVPNHVAIDHPWGESHPEYFIKATDKEYEKSPDYYYSYGRNIYAHGHDPYFDPWTNTLQLNSFSKDLRREVQAILGRLSNICDGVRCDMAMLLTSKVFQQTWGIRGGQPLPQEYWRELIAATKERNPNFVFIAEVYWDMEWELIQQGFDFCYDKRLYDRLTGGLPEAIRGHLGAEWKYQKHMVRFIENHDEPRAAQSLGIEKSKAALGLILTTPGAHLIYNGQSNGAKVTVPVQLGRSPHEEKLDELANFYSHLLKVMKQYGNDYEGWHPITLPLLSSKDGYYESNPLIGYSWKSGRFRIVAAINYSSNYVKTRVLLSDFFEESSLPNSKELNKLNEIGQELITGSELFNIDMQFELDPWEVNILKF